MFGHDRQELRAMYVNAWKKYSEKKILTQLEIQIVEIIKNHPEYHKAIKENDIKIDYTPELGKTNPFLHMSLHISLREQISTNRPKGIAKIYKTILQKNDIHKTEHIMMNILAETLWESQRLNTPPDEEKYFEKLKKII